MIIVHTLNLRWWVINMVLNLEWRMVCEPNNYTKRINYGINYIQIANLQIQRPTIAQGIRK